MANSAAARNRSMRAPSCPDASSPFFHVSAWSAANASADMSGAPCLVLVNPRPELLGRKAGKRQQQVREVAFGIDGDDGTPSIAASSMSERHNPVLPLPVMPTHTAWVTRSRES